MFLDRHYKFLWIGIILFTCWHFKVIKALQCYTCNNCDERKDLNELHICGELPATSKPSFTSSPTNNFTALSNNSAITTNTTLSPEKDNYADYSDEDFEEIVGLPANTTLRPGNIKTSRKTTRSTTQIIRKTTKRPQVNEDGSAEIDGEDSEYDFGDEGDRRNYQLFDSRADDSVCYMVKLRVNGTIVTHRGCSSMVSSNNLLTCESLSSGLEIYDCQLCNTNGCNKFAQIDEDWEAFWNGGEKLRAKIWFLTTLLFMLMLKKYY